MTWLRFIYIDAACVHILYEKPRIDNVQGCVGLNAGLLQRRSRGLEHRGGGRHRGKHRREPPAGTPRVVPTYSCLAINRITASGVSVSAYSRPYALTQHRHMSPPSSTSRPPGANTGREPSRFLPPILFRPHAHPCPPTCPPVPPTYITHITHARACVTAHGVSG